MKFIFALNLILLSTDHLCTGYLALFYPKKAIQLCSKIFGLKIPESKEYILLLKPWGALGIFTGIVGLLPVYDPTRYYGILVAMIILLATRLGYRLKFQKDTTQFLDLSKKRNRYHVLLILVCLVLIIIETIIVYPLFRVL